MPLNSTTVVVRAMVRAVYQPDMMGMIVWSGLFPIVPFLVLALHVFGPRLATLWRKLEPWPAPQLGSASALISGA